MARISAEARAAANFKAGGKGPPPPMHMPKKARDVWIDIVASKPADWFDAGAQVILERMCRGVVFCREIDKEMETLYHSVPKNLGDRMIRAELLVSLEKRLVPMTQSVNMCATKLRLTVQGVIGPQDGRRKERGTPNKASGKKADTLLGGTAVFGNDAEDADESQVN